MKTKIIVGILLIVTGAVLVILGTPFLTMDQRFSSENFGRALINLLLMVGGSAFILGGIASLVSKSEVGQDYEENVWPQPVERKTEQTSLTADETRKRADEDHLSLH